jgi:O-antigen/teichoic acid export membrane protein
MGSVRAQFLMTMGTDGMIGFLGMLTGGLLARALGPVGRGELAAAQTWPAFLCALGSLGVPYAVIYYSAREPQHVPRTMATALLGTAVVSLVVGAAGYTAMPWLLRAHSVSVIQTARAYLWIIPVLGLQGLLVHPYLGLQRYVLWNTLRFLPALAWLGVVLGLRVAGTASVHTVAMSNIAVLAIALAPYGLCLHHTIPGRYRPDFACWVKQLRYGLPCTISTLPQFLNNRVDQLILVAFCAPHDLGLYAVAAAWGSAPQMLLSAVGKVLMPRLAQVRDSRERKRLLCVGLLLSMCAIVPVCCCLLLATQRIIVLVFGARFLNACVPALLLVLNGSVLAVNGCIADGLRGLGDSRATVLPDIVGLCTTLAALGLAVPVAGVPGAAVACVVGALASLGLLLTALNRNVGDYFFSNLREILRQVQDSLRMLLWMPACLLIRS